MVCKYSYCMVCAGGGVMRVKDNCINVTDYDPTVKDSPHPQASLILGFLKTNFELHKFD